ncbi:hypothetical protein [Tepidimicrobium xylanilyticum]
MNLIYNKNTGEIVRAIADELDYRLYYEEWGEDFINSLASIQVDIVPAPLADYYIKDGGIIRCSKQEIEEKQLYGKILTEEERLLNKLKPSHEEIRKAENTIEILTLIQEVI